MLPRSDPKKRIHPDCPPELPRCVTEFLAVGVARKPIFAGETLGDLVARHCPEIFVFVEKTGFELRLDMPENSHKAICKGKLHYQIRRKAAH